MMSMTFFPPGSEAFMYALVHKIALEATAAVPSLPKWPSFGATDFRRPSRWIFGN
jgi:hypothetical protein